MKTDQHYIMRDQVHDKIDTLMAWEPVYRARNRPEILIAIVFSALVMILQIVLSAMQ